MKIWKYIKILSPNPNKDTPLFHLIQIAKTEFIKKAIDLDNNNNNNNIYCYTNNIYAWIDFGIYKIFKSDDEFQQSICNISTYLYKVHNHTIKIPGCWVLNKSDINNDYTRVNWYFCGGFFIGHANTLLEFEKEVKTELEFIIYNDKQLTFEINIWFKLWRNNTIIFDWYYGDHNATMFNNLGMFR